MNRRRFVITSTVALAVVAGAVAGLAVYSNYVVRAAIPGLPEAVGYLPQDAQGVFGANVQKFVASPAFARFEQKQGNTIAHDLGEFTARTGVDPKKDIHYVIAAGHAAQQRGRGAAIAVGTFNTAAITAFIESHVTPIKVDYKGTTVLMIPEKDGSSIEKGVAFIKESEIALGDLESLKAVLDVRAGAAPSIEANPTLGPLLRNLNPDEMFWFAGDAAAVLSKAPQKTPFADSISALETVVGTLDLTDAVAGKLTLTARDEEAARKLTDVLRGFVALGQLAGEHKPEIAELLRGVSVAQDKKLIRVVVNVPYDVIDRLEAFHKGD